MKKLPFLILASAIAMHAQTYTVAPSQGSATIPSTATMLLDYQTQTGIYAQMQLTENFESTASVQFTNTPAGSSYLGYGSLESQSVEWETVCLTTCQQQPSSVKAQFTVGDVQGGSHTVTVSLAYTYSTITIRFVGKRLMRNAVGTVVVGGE